MKLLTGLLLGVCVLGVGAALAQGPVAAVPPVRFRVLAIAEGGRGDHQRFAEAAKVYLNQLGAENGFAVDYISNTKPIDDAFLAKYQLFIQLNYPPFSWTPTAQMAIQRYIEQGKGGWIGFHHAGLLGDFEKQPMSPWFSRFMGGIRFTSYVANFATATVKVEDQSHPVTKGLPPSFVVQHEEWYTWNVSPRKRVHVLASVDESTYEPNSMIKMGDHPVVWTNEHYKARNVYIFMGHHDDLLQNPAFVQLLRNAIFWCAKQPALNPGDATTVAAGR